MTLKTWRASQSNHSTERKRPKLPRGTGENAGVILRDPTRQKPSCRARKPKLLWSANIIFEVAALVLSWHTWLRSLCMGSKIQRSPSPLSPGNDTQLRRTITSIPSACFSTFSSLIVRIVRQVVSLEVLSFIYTWNQVASSEIPQAWLEQWDLVCWQERLQLHNNRKNKWPVTLASFFPSACVAKPLLATSMSLTVLMPLSGRRSEAAAVAAEDPRKDNEIPVAAPRCCWNRKNIAFVSTNMRARSLAHIHTHTHKYTCYRELFTRIRLSACRSICRQRGSPVAFVNSATTSACRKPSNDCPLSSNNLSPGLKEPSSMAAPDSRIFVTKIPASSAKWGASTPPRMLKPKPST